jgi:hypothetical protein
MAIEDESMERSDDNPVRACSANLVVGLLRKIRTLYQLIDGLREALHVSVELLAERDCELDRSRQTIIHLRDQLRRGQA